MTEERERAASLAVVMFTGLPHVYVAEEIVFEKSFTCVTMDELRRMKEFDCEGEQRLVPKRPLGDF